MGTNCTQPILSQNSSSQTTISQRQFPQSPSTNNIYSNPYRHQNTNPPHNSTTIHQNRNPHQNTRAMRNPYKQPIRFRIPNPSTRHYSYQAQITSTHGNHASMPGKNTEQFPARKINDNMLSLRDSDLVELDDVIQRQTVEYNKRRKGTNQNNQNVPTARNMTTGQQIIDLTQEGGSDIFDTIPDDALLSIRIPETQSNSQKKRRITRNPYKK